MRRYNSPRTIINATVVTLAFLSSSFFQKQFETLHIAPFYAVPPIVFPVIGLGLAETAYERLVGGLRFFRRILAGEHYIEGDWVNVVICLARPDIIESVEYCRIRYDKDHFVLTGDTFTRDGVWVNNFHTDGSMYNEKARELEYFYKVGINRTGGYAMIQFAPQDAVPTQFVCRYFDETCDAPYITVGKRASYGFKKYNTKKRGELAVKVEAELKPFAISEIKKIPASPAARGN